MEQTRITPQEFRGFPETSLDLTYTPLLHNPLVRRKEKIENRNNVESGFFFFFFATAIFFFPRFKV